MIKKIDLAKAIEKALNDVEEQRMLDDMHRKNLVTALQTNQIDWFQFIEAWRLANFTDIDPNYQPRSSKSQ